VALDLVGVCLFVHLEKGYQNHLGLIEREKKIGPNFFIIVFLA
jgi:hypothetical protein